MTFASQWARQLARLKKGVNVWNKWRLKNPDVEIGFVEAKLPGANLFGAYLRRVDLSFANLNSADLRNADLSEANLHGVDLRFADLGSANLRGVDLGEADLSDANLSKANLSGSDLRKAIMRGTKIIGSDFSYAFADNTCFASLDFSESNGLADVLHLSPSSISTDVFALSKGRIPEAFLRGCGLSDLDIECAKLANPGLDPEQVTDITYRIHQLYIKGGIQYYACFISYSSKDQEFAQCLYDDLQDNGVRCWFAPEDMKIGDRIRQKIDQEIRLRDKLLVILSENSVKSEWVGDEVEAAIDEESKSNQLVLFPIRLDDKVFNTRDDWAAKIKRRRHIGDFSNWQDKGSYQKAFERLLRDLNATGDKPTEG
jgi:uncharacterized protein YjbI with pentapeptide repeats